MQFFFFNFVINWHFEKILFVIPVLRQNCVRFLSRFFLFWKTFQTDLKYVTLTQISTQPLHLYKIIRYSLLYRQLKRAYKDFKTIFTTPLCDNVYICQGCRVFTCDVFDLSLGRRRSFVWSLFEK